MINGAIRKALKVVQGETEAPYAPRPFMPPAPPARSKSATLKGKDRRKFEDGGDVEDLNNDAFGESARFIEPQRRATLEEKFPHPDNGTDLYAIAHDPREPDWKRYGAMGAGMAGDIAQGAIEQVKKPGQALTGEWDPSGGTGVGASQEAIDWAGNTAMGALGTGTAFNKAPAGSIGLFAGERANYTPAEQNLRYTAKQMTAANKPREDIWQMTNTYRDPVGHFKTEIPDINSVVTLKTGTFGITPFAHHWENNPGYASLMELPVQRYTTLMKDILHHPELYEKYPHIANIPVHLDSTPGYIAGYVLPRESLTGIDPDYAHGYIKIGQGELDRGKENLRSSLLHEIQHVIQEHEKHPSGGSPNQPSMSQVPKGSTPAQRAINKALGNMVARVPGLRSLSSAFRRDPVESYNALLGEMEAYNTEGRRNLDAQQRKTDYPWQNYYRDFDMKDPLEKDILYQRREKGYRPLGLEEYKRLHMLSTGGSVEDALRIAKNRPGYAEGGPAEEQQTLPLRPYEPRYNPKSGKLDAADRKDIGFYGPVKIGPGKVASEYSADADIGQYPLIAADMPEHLKVQALNAARFDAQVPEEAAEFAYKKAKERISKKRSPFYEPGKDPYPEWSPEQHWEKPYGLKEDVKERAMGGRTPAWQRSEGKNPEGGLNAKGRASAKAEGHNLKPPAPHPKTDAAAARRKSFCSRMKGMKAKLTSSETANDPDSRINKSLRAWNCRADGGRLMDDDIMNALRIANNRRFYDNGGTVEDQQDSTVGSADVSGNDQDYSDYINQMLTSLTNNSNFNTPTAMVAPQAATAPQTSTPQFGMPNVGMGGIGMGGAPGAAPQGGQQTNANPMVSDFTSRLANEGFNPQQIGSIMRILQGGQQAQDGNRPFAPAPIPSSQGQQMPGQGMPAMGGFPTGSGLKSGPSLAGSGVMPPAQTSAANQPAQPAPQPPQTPTS